MSRIKKFSNYSNGLERAENECRDDESFTMLEIYRNSEESSS